jgi:hypothetical protein
VRVLSFEVSLIVKYFSELALVERDPATALAIEDGLPACVRMDDYDGLRGLAEVLAYAVPASEIHELHGVARSLGLGNIRVLRVTEAAGFAGILARFDYDCLEEIGISLFAFLDEHYDASERADLNDLSSQLAEQFVAYTTHLETADSTRWEQLAYHTAAARHCGLSSGVPLWLKSQEATLIVDDRPWWGFRQAASTRQAVSFAQYIADHCKRWDYVRGILQTTWSWMEAEGAEYGEFEQMFEAFKANRSLEPWLRAADA